MSAHPNRLMDYLSAAYAANASDLFITPGLPPAMEVHGEIVTMADEPELGHSDVSNLIKANLSDPQKDFLSAHRFASFTLITDGGFRFRFMVAGHKGKEMMVIRPIRNALMTLGQMGLPERLSDLTKKRQGLILVTGPTGSGKSTTLAKLIDHINQNNPGHIITIEDPIEFFHDHKKSVVTQREIGPDTRSYAEALRNALRMKPHQIMIGEMRGPEEMKAALEAAETGHLVFATLHTNSAPETINRMVNAFPAEQQGQIRHQIAAVLVAVLSQQLVRTLDRAGRTAAYELMLGTTAVRSMIKEEKVHQLYSAFNAANSDEPGELRMVRMDDCLYELAKARKISPRDAVDHALDPKTQRARCEQLEQEFARRPLSRI